HRDLLRVLLAEVGAPRTDEVEELQADSRDAPEVTGPVLALEHRAEPLDVDPGLEARRVDLLRGRDEEYVDAGLLRELGVACLVSRVAREVLPLGELGRVDEQACDDELVFFARGPEEREVAFVERTHRRDEAGLVVPRKLRGCANDLHRAVASTSA